MLGWLQLSFLLLLIIYVDLNTMYTAGKKLCYTVSYHACNDDDDECELSKWKNSFFTIVGQPWAVYR